MIGDYTDFTGGLVLPCAINLGTNLIARRTYNKCFQLASENVSPVVRLALEDLETRGKDTWSKYPCGVISEFQKLGFEIDGLDLLYSGNIPSGAGLSSSASIEFVTALAINALYSCGLPPIQLVELCQRAENVYVGTQSGIMDQYAVSMGRADHAVLLDCQQHTHELIPLNLENNSLVVANTMESHDNSSGAYNQRVGECAHVLSILQQHLPIVHLGSLTPAKLALHCHHFDNEPVLALRIKHIVSENHRVRLTAKAIEKGLVHKVGELMGQSHASLRDRFEVSSDSLDLMVTLATNHPSVTGSRMTGAGFGGCTINIVATNQTEVFVNDLGQAYKIATSINPEFYIVTPSDGAHGVIA